MKKLRKIFFSLLSLHPFVSAEDPGLEAITDEEAGKELASAQLAWSLFSSKEDDEGYTINFKNVSIIEYLRFISKISGIDFIYNDAELNFPVTIVSEQPMSLKNILSALVQTLRINGLNLLEQENRLLITRSPSVAVVPMLDIKGKEIKGQTPALITRFFYIKNANLTSVANVVKPMISQASLLEVVPESRLLIITDTLSNIEQIAELIKGLDSTESPLEIEMYRARHIPPTTLISLAKQIVEPFSTGSPLVLVPQTDAGVIFIVSTPALVEKVMEIMEDLDSASKSVSIAQLTGDQVFLYLIENKSHDALVHALKEVGKDIEGSGIQSTRLINALETVKWVPSSNALLFIADAETQTKLKEILKTLDTVSGSRNFYIYKIQAAGEEQIERSLNELAKSLKKNSTDLELVNAIDSMRYIKESNSLLFTGSDEALKKLQTLLPTFDTALAQYSPSNHYWLYTPQYLSGKELESSLEDIEDSLDSAGLADQALLNAISSMKWVPTTNTLLFTGDPNSLSHIESIIKLVDVPTGSPSKIFLYQPKSVSNEQIEEALDELADKLDTKNLADRNLAAAIDHMTWIPESHSFLFRGDPASIEKIQSFLKDLDSPSKDEAIVQTYFLYNLKYARGEDVIAHLESIAKNLPTKELSQRAIVSVIDEISFLKQTNSLLLTGTQKAVDDVKTLIAQFDQPNATPPALEKTSFFFYKPVHLAASQLKAALEQTAQDLKQAGLVDPVLLDSIETMRIVDATNTLVFTGSAESLQKTKEILSFVDSPTTETTGLGQVSGQTFFLYHPHHLPLDQLLGLLINIVMDINQESPNRELVKAVKGAKIVKETNSILFTGPSPVLQKISELLTQLDTGEGGPTTACASNFVVYKPQHINGPELIAMMQEFMQNLMTSGVCDTGLYSTINNLRYIEKTGFVLISGDPASVEKALELLKKFDIPGQGAGVTTLSNLETSFLVYKLQYHSGAELQTTLKQIGQDLMTSDPGINKNLINAINSIQWIKITNSLLATGNPEVLTRLKELIQNVDVPLRQVFIEVLIIETSILNNQQFGLQWGGKVQYLNRFAGGTGNFPSPNPQSSSGAANQQLSTNALNVVNATTTPTASMIPVPINSTGGFDLGVIGDIILHKGKTFISLGSLVNALQQDNDSVVVMNPKIIAQDSQQSTIFVGQNIPFTGSQVSTIGQSSQQISTNIEYRDVGVNLTITPILGTNDVITLDISNDISSQVNSTVSGTNLQGLQTAHTTVNARVHVPNNHFVAFSGMLQDTKTHFKSSIPCLGGLPVIGAIFSENDRTGSKNNVIFFIRPSIIDSVEEFKKITEHQEELFKDQGIKQIVKEEIEDAIDWVKTPDDE